MSNLAEATYGTLKLLEKSGLKIYVELNGGMFVWAQVAGTNDPVPLATQAAKV